jgi:pimeloyl-ACP methyl ester carboxylesterase
MKKVWSYASFRLEYISWGSGTETIICFHGFGRRAEDFELFLPLLQSNQRMIAVNLFAHENSYFPEERIDNDPLRIHEWTACWEAFMKHESFDSFHLIGYSMGGRIALTMLEHMPAKISSVLLFATDGLKKNVLYRFASGTSLGKRIYRRIIDKPDIVFATANFLHALKILHPKLHRFTFVHLDTREKRQQVYDAWLIYKNFFPNLDRLALEINDSGRPFCLVFGKHDSVIPPKLGFRFTASIHRDNVMYVLPSGHRILTTHLVEWIKNNRKWPST